MRAHLPALVASLALLTGGCASTTSTPAQSPTIVPLRSVRLYETGVGYFERSGAVGDAPSLPVPTSHLDDALKSLVLLGPGAQVQGLSFSSNLSRPMARSLVGLPDSAESLSYRDLLTSLKGTMITLSLRKSEQTITGRLVDVSEESLAGRPATDAPESPPPAAEGAAGSSGASLPTVNPAGPALRLVVVTADGGLQRLRADEIETLRPLDPTFARRLGTALDVLAPRSAQVQRSLRLMGQTGPVTFGYIAEAPLWRSSYRLVLEGEATTLQGWALLHNDTDEDWKSVQLTLVNGRPDSFLFPLAAPRYQRRELVHPDEALPTVPQLLSQSPDEMWGEGNTTSYGQGYGNGSGRLSGSHTAKAPTVRMGATTTVGSSGLLSVGNLATVAQASGSEQGALFSYTVGQSISLGAQSSALVPFLTQRVAPRSLTWLERDGARAGIRFENTTGQTLPAGTFAVFRDGGFAGEATLDRLKPGERRFITFGADLDVELITHREKSQDETKRVTASKTTHLEEHFLRTTEHKIELENRSPKPRTVYMVLSLDKNTTVTGADALDFDTAQSKPVAIFELGPKQKLERTFTSVEGLSRRTVATSLDIETLKRLADVPGLPASDRTAVRELLTRRTELADTEKALATSRSEMAQTEKELERLRKSLEALGGDKSTRPESNPFVKRILAAEDRLIEQRKKIEALEKLQKTRSDAVQDALKKFEATT